MKKITTFLCILACSLFCFSGICSNAASPSPSGSSKLSKYEDPMQIINFNGLEMPIPKDLKKVILANNMAIYYSDRYTFIYTVEKGGKTKEEAQKDIHTFLSYIENDIDYHSDFKSREENKPKEKVIAGNTVISDYASFHEYFTTNLEIYKILQNDRVYTIYCIYAVDPAVSKDPATLIFLNVLMAENVSSMILDTEFKKSNVPFYLPYSAGNIKKTDAVFKELQLSGISTIIPGDFKEIRTKQYFKAYGNDVFSMVQSLLGGSDPKQEVYNDLLNTDKEIDPSFTIDPKENDMNYSIDGEPAIMLGGKYDDNMFVCDYTVFFEDVMVQLSSSVVQPYEVGELTKPARIVLFAVEKYISNKMITSTRFE